MTTGLPASSGASPPAELGRVGEDTAVGPTGLEEQAITFDQGVNWRRYMMAVWRYK